MPSLVNAEQLVDEVAGADDKAGESDDEEPFAFCPYGVVAEEQNRAGDRQSPDSKPSLFAWLSAGAHRGRERRTS